MNRGASRRSFVAAVAMVGLLSACGPGDAGRVIRRAAAPVGGAVAEVRDHAVLDGPKQTLWVRASRDGELVQVAALGEDSHWCSQIVWRPDGEQVAFLINDTRLDLFARDASRVASVELVEVDGYPGSREVRDLHWAVDGAIEFRDCARGTDDCSGPQRLSPL